THSELLAHGGLYAELAAQQMAAAQIEGIDAQAGPRDHPERRADRAPAGAAGQDAALLLTEELSDTGVLPVIEPPSEDPP
ncbi:hypothetical protein ACC848_44290, partial [Rhizobium johnstonii]